MLLNRGKSGFGTTGGSFTSTGALGMPGAFGSSPFVGTAVNTIAIQQYPNPLDANCTFTTYTVSFNSAPAAGTKFTPALYTDSSGSPSALIASGTEITLAGTEVGDVTYSFGSSQTLSANTNYWFGLLCNGTLNLKEVGSTATYGMKGYNKMTATYASGPPSTLAGWTSSGNFMCVVLNVTAARGVVGYWDQFPQPSHDFTSGAELDWISVTIPAGSNVSPTALKIRLGSSVVVGNKFKGVVYTDSAGSPSALVTTGTEVVAASANTVLSSTFSTGTLTAGQTYWIGIMSDGGSKMVGQTGTTKWFTNTYASGPPATITGPSASANKAGFYLYYS